LQSRTASAKFEIEDHDLKIPVFDGDFKFRKSENERSRKAEKQKRRTAIAKSEIEDQHSKIEVL
jgi:hypothetical protein